jgi:hypothetical protein
MSRSERRRSARAPAKLAMELKLSGRDFGRLETINVSANGVYFTSPSYIEPLTRLEIVLLLPESSDPGGGRKREVSCEGVVVRTQPESPREGTSQYDIACFFTAISESDRANLEAYILTQLAF